MSLGARRLDPSHTIAYFFSASASGKLKMFLQCVGATASLLSLDSGLASMVIAGTTLTVVRDVLLWSMVVATVWSGWDYVGRAIRILKTTG